MRCYDDHYAYREPGPTDRVGIGIWIEGGGYYGAIAERVAEIASKDPVIRTRLKKLTEAVKTKAGKGVSRAEA